MTKLSDIKASLNQIGKFMQTHLIVGHMWCDNKLIKVDYDEAKNLNMFDINTQQTTGLAALLRCGILCNKAVFKNEEINLKKPVLERETIDGSEPEAAILKMVELKYLSGGRTTTYRESNKKIVDIPFTSSNKYQASVHEITIGDNNNQHLFLLKGSPERVLEFCSTILMDGQEVELTDSWRSEVIKVYYKLGGLGERVLGLCDLKMDKRVVNVNEAPKCENMRFLGLVSVLNPPEPLVIEAVKKCRSAGVRVIMISTDHTISTKGLAKKAGIISEHSETVEDIAERLNVSVQEVNTKDAKACVIHGNDLTSSPEDFDNLLNDYDDLVFARISPQQKLDIVEGCKRHKGGNVRVAVTGDINDPTNCFILTELQNVDETVDDNEKNSILIMVFNSDWK
jgi:sodium/potassium-transporting ATPase subunit alpha